jgi:hypothetical protein
MSRKERIVAALLLAIAVAGGAVIPRLLASPTAPLDVALGPAPGRSVVHAPALAKPPRGATLSRATTPARAAAGRIERAKPAQPGRAAQTQPASSKPPVGRRHASPPTPPTSPTPPTPPTTTTPPQPPPPTTTVVSTPTPLSAGNATCDGSYGGTAKNVTVPSGATCTLAAGTTVAHDLTVQLGGTLINTEVTVGHDLVAQNPAGIGIDGDTVGHDLRIQGISGSATAGGNYICDSTVGHDLVVQGGASSASQFVIGDSSRGCSGGGNKVGHDLVVAGNQNVVTVAGNSVGHATQLQDDSSSGGHTNKPPAPAPKPPKTDGHHGAAPRSGDLQGSDHGRQVPQVPSHPVGDHHRGVGHLSPPPPRPAPPAHERGPQARPEGRGARGKDGHAAPPVAHRHGNRR